MMQSTVVDSDGKSSFQQVFQPYLGGFGALAQAYEPLFKGLARWQLEVLTLSSRRAQAYLEMPSRLAQCRTPQDLAGEQMRFLQTAYQQYTECAQRGLFALTQLGGLASGAATTEAPRERDYMTVSEPKEAPTPPRFTTERERKVA
jgi:phasin protein